MKKKEGESVQGYYKREQNRNCLVFETEPSKYNYKYKMLEQYEISGLLPCFILHIDNKMKVQYDISSKQSLTRICEKRQIDAQSFQGLVSQIQKTYCELERYFLNPDELCLLPEYIYADMENLQVKFCYYPEMKSKSIEQSFHELAEYLINHLDYNDKELIEQGYGMYRYTQQENYDMLNCIRQTLQFKSIKHQAKEYNECEDFPEKELKDANRQMPEPRVAEGRFLSSFLRKIKREDNLNEEEEFHGYEGDVSSVTEVEEDETEDEYYGHTVLLKENKEKSLHYLVALSDGGYEDFSITKFPFVIGKGKDWADGVVPHSLISRIHAQLEELDGEIFLTDLNSTNGTGINEEPLEANQTVQLKTGDIINFAQVYYRFV